MMMMVVVVVVVGGGCVRCESWLCGSSVVIARVLVGVGGSVCWI